MKKILLLFALGFLLVSCSNSESKMKESISSKIKENLKNPESFDFISMKIKSKVSLDSISKRVTQKSINDFKELIKDRAEDDENHLFLERLEKEFNFIKTYKGDKNEAEYYVEFVAKGTNSYGAIIQSKYEALVLNDENKTTLSVTEY